MQASEIIATLRRRSATIRAIESNRLEVVPRRVLDDQLRAAIRSHKAEVLAELRRNEVNELTADPILETRHELGAVRLRSRRFDQEIWIALTEEMAVELRANEQDRETPRPVLLAEDVALLRGRPPEAVQAVLRVAAAFPGARVIQ